MPSKPTTFSSINDKMPSANTKNTVTTKLLYLITIYYTNINKPNSFRKKSRSVSSRKCAIRALTL